MNRRNFTKSISMAAVLPAIPNLPSMKNPTIVHHVFFWLKDPGQAAKLMEGLRTLSGIPQVSRLWIGTPAGTEQRDVIDNSYHVSELIYFESLQAQKEYQDHPVHQKFVAGYQHLWSRVLVYDTVMETV